MRARCAIVSAAAQRGETRHFRLVPGRLDEAVRRVVEVTRRRYPDLAVPFHSRWRHFSTGGVDRAALVAPGADAARNRAGADRSGDRLGSARCRRGAALALSRGGDRAGPVALRGAGGGQPARDAGRPVFRRSRGAVARRCRGAGRDQLGGSRARFSTPPAMSSSGSKGERCCCAGWVRCVPRPPRSSARRPGSAISTIIGRRR